MTVILHVTAENDTFIRGYEVNDEGEKVAPKRGNAPAADTRIHIISKDMIAKRVDLVMNLTFGKLERKR